MLMRQLNLFLSLTEQKGLGRASRIDAEAGISDPIFRCRLLKPT